MAQKAYPLDNTKYLSEDVRLYHVGRTAGIFNATGDDLKVSASGGMNIKVSPGYLVLKVRLVDLHMETLPMLLYQLISHRLLHATITFHADTQKLQTIVF